jgi:hypothetical protein
MTEDLTKDLADSEKLNRTLAELFESVASPKICGQFREAIFNFLSPDGVNSL